MNILIFKIVLAASIFLFFLPKKAQYYFVFVLIGIIISVSSVWAINALFFDKLSHLHLINLQGTNVDLVVDQLSAFFILVVNFTSFTGLLYAKGYLKPYMSKKGKTSFALHYFNLFWLYASMLMVCMLRDGLAFLIIWEIMSLSSFFLVIFESEKAETVKIGIKYLIQMHIGFLFIMFAFLIAFVVGKGAFSFDGLASYFDSHHPYLVFLLFFVGFGIKAGFIPFHTWLPHAHPAAPSHVSGIMSGVMIKMGIYGILRVLTYIHTDLLWIGVFLVLISAISGVLGVSLAIVQHDIKKLLAYHSIENIGIIGIGIGFGVVGLALKMPMLSMLGFLGGLLHILNHSLFKSMLFFTAGNVYQKTHTRNIEHFGGIIKKMPKTAYLFLLAALAICGLPPFNGFISEFLIYSGLFKSLSDGNLLSNLLIVTGFVSLALIGGLAIFCFTKVFGIMFLGSPRTEAANHAKEVEKSMLFPIFLIGIMIIAIGFAPVIFINPLKGIVQIYSNQYVGLISTYTTLQGISLSAVVFVTLIIVLWWVRKIVQHKQFIDKQPTWGCAYTGGNPALQQYTATSYAGNFVDLANLVTNVDKHFYEFREEEIFPQAKSFQTHSTDVFENNLISTPGTLLLKFMKKIAVFQSGKLQHYLLYALVFMALIMLLTFFNWI